MTAHEEIESALAEAQARYGRTRIAVYPVGVLAAGKTAWAWARYGRRRDAYRRLRYEWRRLYGHATKSEWRPVRMAFNGYLAEIAFPPSEIVQRTCGHGWTKRRAARRMGEYLWRDNRGSS